MDSTRIRTVLDQLRAEESELQERLERLRGDVRNGETQLSQIRKAMSSLKGKASTATVNSKRTATKEEVLAAITNVLREVGSASEENLKKLVEQRLGAEGKSRTGFAMRFKNALKNEQFVRTGSGLGLAKRVNEV